MSTAAAQPSAAGRSRPARATIDDVAAAAGVSRQTVSNVVNGTGRMSDATRRRIQAVIAELEYRPHRAASGLRTRRTLQIAHPMPATELLPGNSFGMDFVQALVSAAGKRRYHILLAAADGAGGIADLIRSGSVDAVILANMARSDPRAELLARRRIPFACMGRTDPSLPQCWVDVDNHRAVRNVVARLAAGGHRQIGYLGYRGYYWDRDREAGYRAGMADAGLPVPRALVRLVSRSQVTAAIDALLDRRPRPTAIVTGSDTLAAAVYVAAGRRNLAIGADRDLAVTGFDDSSLGRILVPSLTTVSIPVQQIAPLLLDRVLRELEQPTDSPGQLIEAPLVPGESA